MFENFKGKILAAVADNTSLLVTNAFKPSDSQNISVPNPSSGNYNAGATILSHIQDEWVSIHNNNELNSVLVNHIEKNIDQLNQKSCADLKNLNDIIGLLTSGTKSNSIPVMIDKCNDQLATLKQSFENIERELIELENVVEIHELEKKKLRKYQQLVQYNNNKIENLNCVKREWEAKHAIFMRLLEARQQKVLQERQEVFLEAFKNDLALFEQTGTVQRIGAPAVLTDGPALEDIQIDCNTDELDKFLNV